MHLANTHAKLIDSRRDLSMILVSEVLRKILSTVPYNTVRIPVNYVHTPSGKGDAKLEIWRIRLRL